MDALLVYMYFLSLEDKGGKLISCSSVNADLVPKEVVEKWLKYLREELPTVAFKCSTQQQRSHLGQKRSSKSANESSTSECLGAETLLQLLKNYSRNNKVAKECYFCLMFWGSFTST